MAQWKYQLSGNFLGATVTRMGCISPPFSLVQNRTGDFCAPFARLRRSALQPPLQCSATVHAVHCIRPCSALHPSLQCTASSTLIYATFPANVCNLSRKRLQPPLQTFAVKDASFRNPSSCFSTETWKAAYQGEGDPL